MASTFYIVHHHLKPEIAGEWWGKTGTPMSDETVFAQNIKTTMEKGFFNHAFMLHGRAVECRHCVTCHSLVINNSMDKRL